MTKAVAAAVVALAFAAPVRRGARASTVGPTRWSSRTRSALRETLDFRDRARLISWEEPGRLRGAAAARRRCGRPWLLERAGAPRRRNAATGSTASSSATRSSPGPRTYTLLDPSVPLRRVRRSRRRAGAAGPSSRRRSAAATRGRRPSACAATTAPACGPARRRSGSRSGRSCPLRVVGDRAGARSLRAELHRIGNVNRDLPGLDFATPPLGPRPITRRHGFRARRRPRRRRTSPTRPELPTVAARRLHPRALRLAAAVGDHRRRGLESPLRRALRRRLPARARAHRRHATPRRRRRLDRPTRSAASASSSSRSTRRCTASRPSTGSGRETPPHLYWQVGTSSTR